MTVEGKYNGIARYWRSWMYREEDLDCEFGDWICLCLTIKLSPRTYPMSFHTLQISSSHHSAMFHSAFVFEHEYRIHECISMHTVFVTLHICLLPTTFSGWQLVPHPSPTCVESLSADSTCLGAVAGWIWEHSDERSHEAASPIWNAGFFKAHESTLSIGWPPDSLIQQEMLRSMFYLNEAQFNSQDLETYSTNISTKSQ